ncbi:MAG: hypothetical protein Q8R70_00300 [Methanoregula sp.]|nr:hypothetical protein [Methanoregula sp.]
MRAKAFDRLSDARKPEIPAPAIDTELQNARHLAEQTGGDLAAFQAIALKKCGMEDYIPALKASPSLIHGEVGWFIPTQLGEMCALTAIQFNHWLNNKGYQYREGNVWRLQPLGEMHGQEYWFEAPSGHREIRIRWRESILYASGLKREIPASQLMLPAQAQRA